MTWLKNGLGGVLLILFFLRVGGENFGIKITLAGSDIALCVLAVALLLRDELGPFLSRIIKVKWGDKEIELAREAEALNARVDQSKYSEPSAPVTPPLPIETPRPLLQIASQNPSLAIVEIGRRMKQILSHILLTTGWMDPVSLPGHDLIEKAIEKKVLTPELGQTVRDFWRIRNAVAHSLQVPQTISSSVIDSGLQLLEQLEMIQNRYERHEVAAVDVEVFSDPPCERRISNEKAVILKTSRDGQESFRIFPTRRDYRVGQVLSWHWDMKAPFVGPAWFKDPLNGGRCTQAWGGAAHFAGEPIGAKPS